MRRTDSYVVLILVLLGVTATVNAQCEYQWSDGFQLPGIGGNALATFDDGSGPALFVAGDALMDDGSVSSLRKWNGTQWSDFPTPLENVYDMLVFDDGAGPALYLGGDGGKVYRWKNLTWSQIGNTLGGQINKLAVFDDGTGHGSQLYVAGSMSGGVKTWDGTFWLSVGGGLPAGTAYAQAVFDDGTGPALYVAGKFDKAGSLSVNNIAKWNGRTWSALGGGVQKQVLELAVFDDGRGPALYAGGSMNIKLKKWDGLTWTTIDCPNTVGALEVWDDGTGTALFVGTFGYSGLGILKFDGQSWSSLGSGVEDGYGVGEIMVFDDGVHGPNLIATGSFHIAGDLVVGGIASWDGELWSGFATGNGVHGQVLSLLPAESSGKPTLYVGGEFTSVGAVRANSIAAWDGKAWSALGEGFPGRRVRSLAMFDDGSGSGPQVYAGGSSLSFDPAVGSLAKWNGSEWLPVLSKGSTQKGIDGSVYSMCIYDDGEGPALYVGGGFDSVDGIEVHNVAKWNGVEWSALGGGVTLIDFKFGDDVGSVNAFEVFDDGQGDGPALYVGGSFDAVDGAPANSFAKWTGSEWQILPGVYGGIRSFAVFNDGTSKDLYAGGGIYWIPGGSSLTKVAKWDGKSWSSLGTGVDDFVTSLVVFSDGSRNVLCAGGYFDVAGSLPATRIASWSGSSWSPLGQGVLLPQPAYDTYVSTLAVFDGGGGPGLFVGGSFYNAGDQLASNIAKWSCESKEVPCLGDVSPVNGNGTVDIGDLLTVIDKWGACASACPPCLGDADANCVVDVDDLLTVINAWGPCR